MGNRFVRAIAVGAVVTGVLALVGCTSGPTASIAPLETAVLLAAGEGEAKAVSDEVTASQGDVVSTDAGGLAEVGFPDGSFMRLGPDSEVTITELGSAEAQRTSIALDIGETWHNVEELVAEDSVYEVVTPVGVASVRGTVFAITCVEGPSCTFLVLDGEIDVDGITVTPYERLVLPEQSEPAIVSFDGLGDWASANVERDGGAEDAVALPDPPLEAASLAGEWAGGYTTTTTNSTVADRAVGTVSDRTWTIEESCDATCQFSISASNSWTLDVERTGASWTMQREGDFSCYDNVTGEETLPGAGTFVYVYDMTIDAAEWQEDRWVATAISGSLDSTETLRSENAERCSMNAVDGGLTIIETQDMSFTRAD